MRTKPKLRTAPLTIRIEKDTLTEKLLAPSPPRKANENHQNTGELKIYRRETNNEKREIVCVYVRTNVNMERSRLKRGPLCIKGEENGSKMI